MRLELSAEEAAMLEEVLRRDLGDLRMEIADTDKKDFRDGLKQKEALIKSLIERLTTKS
jgi:hypothetical protein